MSNQDRKKKIAIFGGGMSALSTAFELTDYEGWDDHYEITLYQLGWRLGGKCATGRGDNDRIEEHGIHVFLGFYNNAIRLVRQAYEAWEKMGLVRPDYPFSDWRALFHLQNSIMLPEFSPSQKRWLNWPMVFPQNDLTPGIGGAPSELVNIKKMLILALELILGSPYLEKKRGCLGSIVHFFWNRLFPKPRPDELPSRQPGSLHHLSQRGEHPSWWSDLKQDVETKFKDVTTSVEHKYLLHARDLADQLPETDEEASLQSADLNLPHLHSQISKLLTEFIIHTEAKIVKRVQDNDGLRRFWTLAQLAMVNLRGLDGDCYDPKTGKYDFTKINDVDYRDWIMKWGAPKEVAFSSPVKDLYALVFAYPNGDTTQPGQIAAGTAVLGALLIVLGYKGAVMWRFHGGTAEVIADPLFEVLKARGVNFKFFHELEEVHYNDGNEIDEITVGKQIRLKDESKSFEPTKEINGLHCWPSHPFWRWEELGNQIDPADMNDLRNSNVNLESSWSGWKNRETFTLKKGVDFDQAVLGVSLAGLKDICADIIKNKESWSNMVDNVQTVQTQAVQLWFNETIAELGMDLPKLGLNPKDNPILDTYVDPINSYADMTELVRWESWPSGNMAKSLAYFCGPLQEFKDRPPYSDTGFPKIAHDKVQEMARQWLNDNAGFLWPKAMQINNPNALDLMKLVDPKNEPGTSGPTRFDRQFFRANIDPSERYVLSVPKSGKFRLKADETEYHNLFFTGDWIDNGYNMGCVECAVMSGLETAQAIRRTYGFSDHKPIIRDL